MGLKSQFQTSKDIEKNGIVLDYGETRIRIARAGGANKKYQKRLEACTRPHRRAIKNDLLDIDKGNELLMEAFAHAVVVGWENKTGEEKNGNFIFSPGVDPEDAGLPKGDLLPLNPSNVLKVFKNLPDLFLDVQEQATKSVLFREDIRDTDLEN